MTVTNKTSVTLEILGRILKPNQTKEYPEMMFSTLDIHSEIGSCIITTKYAERHFKNSGKLVAKEGNKKDKYGMKNILVYSIDWLVLRKWMAYPKVCHSLITFK